jgi:hypothetical protein
MEAAAPGRRAARAPSITHAKAASLVASALQGLDLGVTKALDQKDGYDYLVEGKSRITVRYAFPASYREQFYKKRNGEVSRYVYKRWTFNFHRHGKITSRYCDFFVCLLGASQPTARKPSPVTVFVIPWEAITGLTFCSSVRDDSPRPYKGRYARFIDGWERIVVAGKGESAGLSITKPSVTIDSRFRLKLGEAAAANPASDPAPNSPTSGRSVDQNFRSRPVPSTLGEGRRGF